MFGSFCKKYSFLETEQKNTLLPEVSFSKTNEVNATLLLNKKNISASTSGLIKIVFFALKIYQMHFLLWVYFCNVR